jgi:hypothetical protein
LYESFRCGYRSRNSLGSSFGGGHVLVTAANDKNVSAVISQCPFTDGPSSVLAPGIRTSPKVAVLSLLDKIGAWIGRPPLMPPTAGSPGTTALMTAPDAKPGYLALVPEDMRFRNEVAARIGLDILSYLPGRKAPEIRLNQQVTLHPSGRSVRCQTVNCIDFRWNTVRFIKHLFS